MADKLDITTYREMDGAVERMFTADRPRELDERLIKVFARTPWWPFMFILLGIPLIAFGILFYNLVDGRLDRYTRYSTDYQLDQLTADETVSTTAQITWAGGVHAKKDNSDDIFRVLYTFKDERGIEYLSEGYLTRGDFQKPEDLKLPVVYARSNPSLNRPVGGTRAYPDTVPYALLTLVFIIAPFAGTGITVWVRRQEIKRYLQQGVAVKAKVSDIAIGLPLFATLIMDVIPMGGDKDDRIRLYSPRLKHVHPGEAMAFMTQQEYIRVLVIPHKKKNKIKALALESARLVDPKYL